MSREETLGYALSIRAEMWSNRQIYDRAVADFRSAMQMYPEAPLSYNNFAWMIATRNVPDRKVLLTDAWRSVQGNVDRQYCELHGYACLRLRAQRRLPAGT